LVRTIFPISCAALVAACGARTGLIDPIIDASPMDGRVDAPEDAFDAHVGCTPGDITLVAAEPEVMFVLDRSGSMRTLFQGSQTRWQVLTSALATSLPPVDSTMAIGALLFPAGSSNADCTVASQPDLAPALNHVQSLVDLMQSRQPGGSTPTSDAIDTAATLLLDVRAATAARALVLATDGAPNCNASLNPHTCTCASGNNCHGNAEQCLDDARTVQQIAAVFAHGVPTYVIGIADSGDNTFSDVLNAMAQAGGRPLTNEPTSYYPARSEADLDTAITTIRNQVGACTYLTTSVPGDAGSIVVTLDGQTLPFDPDGGTFGWTWANESNGEITLVGSTCADVAADASAAALVAHVECGSDAD
jgi:hypothetical protein